MKHLRLTAVFEFSDLLLLTFLAIIVFLCMLKTFLTCIKLDIWLLFGFLYLIFSNMQMSEREREVVKTYFFSPFVLEYDSLSIIFLFSPLHLDIVWVRSGMLRVLASLSTFCCRELNG